MNRIIRLITFLGLLSVLGVSFGGPMPTPSCQSIDGAKVVYIPVTREALNSIGFAIGVASKSTKTNTRLIRYDSEALPSMPAEFRWFSMYHECAHHELGHVKSGGIQVGHVQSGGVRGTHGIMKSPAIKWAEENAADCRAKARMVAAGRNMAVVYRVLNDRALMNTLEADWSDGIGRSIRMKSCR